MKVGEKKKVTKEKKQKGENKNIEKYLKDTKAFWNKELKKKVMILSITTIVLTILLIVSVYKAYINIGESYNDLIKIFLNKSLWTVLKDNIMLGIGFVFGGLVPYIYIPAIVYMIYVLDIIKILVNSIYLNGIFLGIVKGFIPFVLSIISNVLFVSLGIYFCKINSNIFRASQTRRMNLDRFKLEIQKIKGNAKKIEQLELKIKERQAKYETGVMKVNYIQLINFSLMGIVLAAITSIMTYILR